MIVHIATYSLYVKKKIKMEDRQFPAFLDLANYVIPDNMTIMRETMWQEKAKKRAAVVVSYLLTNFETLRETIFRGPVFA